MKFLLDTNTCIRYINGRSQKIREKLPTIPLVDVGVSIITKAEMYYGSARPQPYDRRLGDLIASPRCIQKPLSWHPHRYRYNECRR